jgi:diguanylate cyclase (GGDEF)-like protein
MTPRLSSSFNEIDVGFDTTFSESAAHTIRAPRYLPGQTASQQACLVYIYPTGPLVGTRYPLRDNQTLIGRNEDCAIRNQDESVSRYHACIIRERDDLYRVADLGSTNGTFVNNSYPRETFLRDGDYLRIGNCIYRFLAGGDVESAYHEEIYRLTILDGLTQVYNRRYMVEFLQRELTRAVRYERPLALILLNIDRFKVVNDKLGHLVGDMALRELCSRVRTLVRHDELVARSGGDEFALILPEADHTLARGTAERLRLLVEQQPFVFNHRAYFLTVSVGVVVMPKGESPTVDALFGQADTNMNRAKQAGRNRVVIS